MIYVFYAFLLLTAAGIYCALYFPFWKKKQPVLPVLKFGKIGRAPQGSAFKNQWLTRQQFIQRLDWVLKLGFTPVTPEDVLAARQGVALPPRPVILVFEYGLASFYTEIFPLLQERGLKACVCLCTEQIGQYNAWQDPRQEPWQNTLNEGQLAELKKSKLISFALHGLSYINLNTLPQPQALQQAQESKARLEKVHKLNTVSFFYPQEAPLPPLDTSLHAAGFEVTFSPQSGNNPLAKEPTYPLKTLNAAQLGLWRLRAKITRL